MLKSFPLYSDVKFRPIQERDYTEIKVWFREPSFYFLTKRPDTLSDNQILEIIKNSYIFINNQEGKVGIAKIIRRIHLSKEIKVAFRDKMFYSNDQGIGYFFNFLKMLFYDKFFTQYVYQMVYSFDQDCINLCERSHMNLDGKLKNHIYKWGKYYDILIYGLTRDQFLKITGLKKEDE